MSPLKPTKLEYLHQWYCDFTTLAQGPPISSAGTHIIWYVPDPSFFLPFFITGCSLWFSNAESYSGAAELQPHHQNFLFCFVLVLIWGCFREVAMSQMQFREEPDDLTGTPEGVPTPAGSEICHHIQVQLHTSPLLPQVPASRNTTLEMVNAIYLCWFIIHLLRNKYNLTIPWAAGRQCGKGAFLPFSILPL